MGSFAGYPADTLRFLRSLKRNNRRDWFADNKDRYERVIVQPSLQLIADVHEPLLRLSPHFSAVPRKVGGSLMRIYRDTRFASDKTPYKTNIGIQFRHIAGRDVHAPGFYVHIEPGSVFLGAGIWHPEPRVARLIRDAICDNPAAWRRAISGKKFSAGFALTGASLKRPPRGFDKQHALIADLQRKDFIAVRNCEDSDIHEAKFAGEVVASMRTVAPLMRFLCAALDLPF